MSIRDRVRDSGGFMNMRRYPKRGWVAGVCVGLAEYFDWNVKLLRVIFAVGLIFSGFFPIGVIYLLLWYLMDPVDGTEATGGDYARAQRHYDSPAPAYAGGTTDVKSRFARLEERLRNMEECVASKDFELRRELKKLES